MKQLSLKTINASSPYDVMMVNPNTYRFVTDHSVEIAISFDLDDLLEHGEAYMFNITNVNKQRSPRDMKVRDTVIAIIDIFLRQTSLLSFIYVKRAIERKLCEIACLILGLLMLMTKNNMSLWLLISKT
nr:hypothetical protein [Segatella copri]